MYYEYTQWKKRVMIWFLNELVELSYNVQMYLAAAGINNHCQIIEKHSTDGIEIQLLFVLIEYLGSTLWLISVIYQNAVFQMPALSYISKF